MFANRFTVVVDACVLVPGLLRDLVLSLAEADLFRVRWTPEIMAETERAVAQITKSPAAASSVVEQIGRAFPEALISGHDALTKAISSETLGEVPDKGDAHVMAGAITVCAALIVTSNRKDFPPWLEQNHGITVVSPDEFLANTIDLPSERKLALSAVGAMRKRLRRPHLDQDGFLERLAKLKLHDTAGILDANRGAW